MLDMRSLAIDQSRFELVESIIGRSGQVVAKVVDNENCVGAYFVQIHV